jgi:diacylglycerol O-acyltransferase
MRRMPLADAFFLINESRATPMHVGGVNLYTLPEGVDEVDFIAELSEVLRYDGPLRRPFGERLKMSALGPFGPVHWEPDALLDIDYHIRHSALPKPGRYRELFSLVSRLHGQLLDRNRPLWELYLIEGLQNRQVATYFKVHHCAIDGVGAMHMTDSMMSTSPRARMSYSPFSMEAYQAYKESLPPKAAQPRPSEQELRAVLEMVQAQFGSTVNIAKAMRQYASVWVGRGGKLSVPWRRIPKTAFNTQITGARRFVAQSWPFERIRTVGRALDGTLNDTVLAMCSGALRRYLVAQRELPAQSLKAMAPISLREDDDVDSANAIGFLTTDLATNVKDPERRFRTIQESMAAAKGQLSGMSRREVEIYTMVTQAPLLLLTLLGLSGRFPPVSTIISNVPGPRRQLYWNGARLDGMYPVSVPFHGIATNITLVSNVDNIDFGITACRRSMPQVQRLIDYMEDALAELEAVAGLRPAAKPAARLGRRPRRKEAGAGTAAKAKTKARVSAGAKSKAKGKAKTKRGVKVKAKAKAKTRVKSRTPAGA